MLTLPAIDQARTKIRPPRDMPPLMCHPPLACNPIDVPPPHWHTTPSLMYHPPPTDMPPLLACPLGPNVWFWHWEQGKEQYRCNLKMAFCLPRKTNHFLGPGLWMSDLASVELLSSCQQSRSLPSLPVLVSHGDATVHWGCITSAWGSRRVSLSQWSQWPFFRLKHQLTCRLPAPKSTWCHHFFPVMTSPEDYRSDSVFVSVHMGTRNKNTTDIYLSLIWSFSFGNTTNSVEEAGVMASPGGTGCRGAT